MDKLFEKINKYFGTDYKSTEEIDWVGICIYYTLDKSFIVEYQDKLKWFYISAYQKLDEDFIIQFQDKVNWDNISQSQKLSVDFIRKYSDRLNWNLISMYQKLDEKLISEFQNKVNWEFISKYQKLSEDFIEKHYDQVYWKNISYYQLLSDDFIWKFRNKIDWYNPYRETDKKEEFIKYYKSKTIDNFGYLSTEQKKVALIATNKYDCYDDYFIAYKTIRHDRYSIYNFQYQYLEGNTYESWCNCTNTKNSFGLSVATADYCNNFINTYKRETDIIVKCKINYEDIGMIYNNGEIVRCFKITII